MKSGEQQNETSVSHSVAENISNGGVSFAPPSPFAVKKEDQTEGDTVQRVVSESHHENDDNRAAAVAYENEFNTAVQHAHHHVIAAPRLGALANFDGHTAKWVEDWRNTMRGHRPGSLATSFGYAIESLATSVYLPEDPDGMSHQLQGVRNGTRPDLILVGDYGDVAWLDITASASAGHIWDKAGWDEQDHVSEVTYPSLGREHTESMTRNNDVTDPPGFDPEAFEAQMAQAIKLRDYRRLHWAGLGGEIKEQYSGLDLASRMVAELDPMLYRQNPMLCILIERFNLGFDPPPLASEELQQDHQIEDTDQVAELRTIAPHILKAMSLGTRPYGFVGGGPLTGEVWLLHNDPELPQPEDVPEESEEDLDAPMEMIE